MNTDRTKFQKADQIICKVIKYFSFISVATITIMGFLATIDVATSKFLGFAVPITNDIIKYFIVPTCFCLIAEVQISGGMMQVDLFSRKYGPKMRKFHITVGCVLGIIVFGFGGIRGTALLIKYIKAHELSSMSGYAFQLWPFVLIMDIGIFLLVLAFFWTAVKALKKSKEEK